MHHKSNAPNPYSDDNNVRKRNTASNEYELGNEEQKRDVGNAVIFDIEVAKEDCIDEKYG